MKFKIIDAQDVGLCTFYIITSSMQYEQAFCYRNILRFTFHFTLYSKLQATQPPNESIDAVVNMIEMGQDEWVEEVLDDSAVGIMLNDVQFDNLFADDSECA